MFTAFTAPILARHPGIRALEWAPRVRLEDRAAFEREIRQNGLPEFQITERAETNEMVRASSRKEYFPVLYVEPLEDNLQALGFDLGSVANRKATIERAAKSGLAMATGRIRLVQEPGGFSTLVLSPVYRAGASLDTEIERRDALKGFVVGVFSLNKMLGAPSADGSEGLSPFALDLHIVDEQASAPDGLARHREIDLEPQHEHRTGNRARRRTRSPAHQICRGFAGTPRGHRASVGDGRGGRLVG
ncbi:MAG: CHASE domain-containing protein [Proteobacteria bacterium]|nr:CHASE domain-containing protein [Pseudomonadota bacterium]